MFGLRSKIARDSSDVPKKTPSKKPATKPKPKKILKAAQPNATSIKPVATSRAAAKMSVKAATTPKKTPKPRDPSKTERNRIIKEMSEELRSMVDQVLAETGWKTEASLNAVIGGKAAEFIDLHHAQILSPDSYLSLYMKGFDEAKAQWGAQTHRENYERFNNSKIAQKYFALFLKRSYLKHFDEYSRKRPHLEESVIWIGQNKAHYGLFITPVWRRGEWVNDRSEIRHFPKRYWTIGHVLASGLVVDGDEDPIRFADIEAYLAFFKNTLVRASGSPYEKAIAKCYVDFVRAAPEPEHVPLLIPEFRYGGKDAKHGYRLDFTIINPFTMEKVGFELSPWSTHGQLKGTKTKKQAEINEEAKANFEKEAAKLRAYFKKHGVYALIYTDTQLADIPGLFAEMEKYLSPVDKVQQLDFDLLNAFFK